MQRVLLAIAVLWGLSPVSSAGETAVEFHVQPMAAPVPALKYQLLPQVEELNPGNAAQNYLKCFMEQHYFFFSKEAVADRDRFENMPLIDLAREKLEGYGGGALARRIGPPAWKASTGRASPVSRAAESKARLEKSGRFRFSPRPSTCAFGLKSPAATGTVPSRRQRRCSRSLVTSANIPPKSPIWLASGSRIFR